MANAELRKVIEAAHATCPCISNDTPMCRDDSCVCWIPAHTEQICIWGGHAVIDAALRAVATAQRTAIEAMLADWHDEGCASVQQPVECDCSKNADLRLTIRSTPLVVDEEEKP